jgi:hypothetical protein
VSNWERRGLVFAPPGAGLLASHAMLPTPLVLADRIRVFFAACDLELRGRIFRVDLDRDDPRRLLASYPAPVLDLGPPGAFDADGVNPSQVVRRDGKLFLYFIGWQRISTEVPYRLFAGLAVSEDEGASFVRHGDGQILLPEGSERYFRTAPFVFPAADGRWEMLYIGGDTFFNGCNSKRLPTYSLYRAASHDGVTWTGGGFPLLDPDRAAGEIGFGRPVLWHHEGTASLLISRRTESSYMLRALAFKDGALRWSEPLGPGTQSWDTSMTCFGAPCAAGAWEYLFYNGNEFGRSGFGLARRPVRSGLAQKAGIDPALLINAIALAREQGSGREAIKAMKVLGHGAG